MSDIDEKIAAVSQFELEPLLCAYSVLREVIDKKTVNDRIMADTKVGIEAIKRVIFEKYMDEVLSRI